MNSHSVFLERTFFKKRGGAEAKTKITFYFFQQKTLKETKEIEWRVWNLIAEQIRPLITQVKNWKKEYVEEAKHQLKERKRRRKRQLEVAQELLSVVMSIT